MTVIDDHLARFPAGQRAALEQTVAAIRTALPHASEVISYGMPTFKVGGPKGDAVLGIDGFAKHNSVFPYSGGVLASLADELVGYEQTKSALHFPKDRPLPTSVLKKVLRARIAEINASYPKKNGTLRRYALNGALKKG
jgi:uncharacterized protein YdhG (YjbR/CyaY superfamily)